MYVCVYICLYEGILRSLLWLIFVLRFLFELHFFFALHHSVCFAYFILFLICCFSVRCSWDIGFFSSALWLCLGEIKKTLYISHSPTSSSYSSFSSISFIFSQTFFSTFISFTRSLTHSLSPSSYSVNLISCSFCAICHTRKCSMFTYKYSYKLLLYYYISRTHQKCE